MEQQTFDLTSAAKKTGPVTCLGMTFPDEAARRAHFTALLAEKLKDPEFRKIEGFPLGTDEDILALSDPPYYCACPNPWIDDFLKEWEAAKPPKPLGYKYEREPFAADVSEGKNDPIYNAHSYHTKVPHKAIMRYILHYTEPGDIVFDGFCGTGMTGVAAQLCGDIEQVRSLGYKVDEKTGAITDPNAEDPKKVISHLGARKAVLNDLAPVATFISSNYNAPLKVEAFEQAALNILKEVEDECGWMYKTRHVRSDGQPVEIGGMPVYGKIEYVVWSDVFVCPYCQGDVVFYDAAVDKPTGKVSKDFPCPHCQGIMSKKTAKHLQEVAIDTSGNVKNVSKQVPVLVCYSVPGKRQSFSKRLDEYDYEVLAKVESYSIDSWFPQNKLPDGFNTRQPAVSHGLVCVDQFYTKRNLIILAEIKKRCTTPALSLWFNSQLINLSKLNRYRPEVSFPYNPLNGTLYVASQVSEADVFKAYKNKLKRLVDAFKMTDRNVVTSTCSTTQFKGGMYDYMFWDPPFGANINYSELSSIWESWLKVMTNNKQEAIVNDVQEKDIHSYRDLMTACFATAYNLLKPGRWMTVEFSNTSASIWNGIQTALSNVGFIVANVSALNKQQGSFKAVTTPTAVKQDLNWVADKITHDMLYYFT